MKRWDLISTGSLWGTSCFCSSSPSIFTDESHRVKKRSERNNESKGWIFLSMAKSGIGITARRECWLFAKGQLVKERPIAYSVVCYHHLICTRLIWPPGLNATANGGGSRIFIVSELPTRFTTKHSMIMNGYFSIPREIQQVQRVS